MESIFRFSFLSAENEWIGLDKFVEINYEMSVEKFKRRDWELMNFKE